MTTTKLLKFSLFAGVGILALANLNSCAKGPFELELVGYDYTDRAILDFSVSGASGGNIFLSTKTSGGGKYACCVILNRATKTPFSVDVEYMREALVAYPSDRIIKPADTIQQKTRVEVTLPAPGLRPLSIAEGRRRVEAMSRQDTTKKRGTLDPDVGEKTDSIARLRFASGGEASEKRTG